MENESIMTELEKNVKYFYYQAEKIEDIYRRTFSESQKTVQDYLHKHEKPQGFLFKMFSFAHNEINFGNKDIYLLNSLTECRYDYKKTVFLFNRKKILLTQESWKNLAAVLKVSEQLKEELNKSVAILENLNEMNNNPTDEEFNFYLSYVYKMKPLARALMIMVLPKDNIAQLRDYIAREGSPHLFIYHLLRLSSQETLMNLIEEKGLEENLKKVVEIHASWLKPFEKIGLKQKLNNLMPEKPHGARAHKLHKI